MKLSLNKLHKYKAVLEKEVQNTHLNLQRFSTVSLSDDPYHSVKVAENLQKQQENQFQAYCDISSDLSQIKTALFTANVQSGVNHAMNKLQELKTVLSHLKRWKTQSFMDFNPTYSLSDMAVHTLTTLKQSSLNGCVNLEVVSESSIQERISTLNKQIRELENTQEKANTDWEVEIEFTAVTKEVLGL